MANRADTVIGALATLTGSAGAVARTAGGLLVLDAAGERLLGTSGAAVPLAPDLTPGDRDPIAGQLRALAGSLPREGRPRLERLRLGPDRLAPPVTCTCLRTELPGHGTVLVIALPGERRAAGDAPESIVGADAAPAVPDPTRPNLRFLWRSDAEGRLFEASSVLADRVRGGVVGRTWSELLNDTVTDEAGGLSEALSARATFRALPVRWRIGGEARSLAAELSATPRRAPDGAFAGYDGFGLIEAAPVLPSEPDAPPDEAIEAPVAALPAEPVADPVAATAPAGPPPPAELITPAAQAPEADGSSASPAAPDLPAFASLAGAAMAGWTEIVTAPFGFGWPAAAVTPRSPDPAPMAGPPVAEAPATRGTVTETEAPVPSVEPGGSAGAPEVSAPPSASAADEAAPASDSANAEPVDDSHLSLSEHHAFREIARALGARFAGDEIVAPEAAPAAASASVTPLRPFVRAAAREDDVAGGALGAGSDGGVPGGDDAETRLLLDRLPIGTLVHRGETALYANRAFLETVGYADVPELQQDGGVARLFRGGPAGGRRNADAAAVGVSTKSGGTVPVEVRVATVPWGRDPAGLMLVRRLPDVDPVQRAAALELELAAARARLRELAAILDATGDAVVTADARLRLTSLNDRAEALFGYAAGEVAGEPLGLLVAAESHPALHGLVETARTIAGPADGPAAPLTGRGRHGADLPLAARLARLPAGPGEIPAAAFCAVFSDASAARAAAAKLEAAEAASRAAGDRASAFLERAGHEIRAPLNTMLGFAELMLEERSGPLGERYRDYLRDLHASGSRLVGRVGDLLDLARLESGRQPMTLGPVDLGAVAASCVTGLQARASRARIVVRTSFSPDLPKVRADVGAIRQAAEHLLANAIGFTEAGGQVIVSTGVADGAVFLRVRDTGIGMTRDEAAAALDAFRAPNAASVEAGSATGLGLPLARALAAANGAALHVQSAKGEGTLVEVLVPPDRIVRG